MSLVSHTAVNMLVMLVLWCLATEVLSLEMLSGSGFSIYDATISTIKCSCDRRSDYDVSETNVYVNNYETGSNNTYLIADAASAILSAEHFDPDQCIIIFIPGFNSPISSVEAKSALCIFPSIKCNGKNILGLFIDTYKYTKGGATVLQNPDAYKDAVVYTKSIGLAVGKFLAELIEVVDKRNVDIFGHSLGAHICGYAGNYLKEQGTSLKSCYGGDPAGPCFEDCTAEHLQRGQADVVYSFHTTQILGTTQLDLADYDFISEDGKTQKGCGYDIILGLKEGKCSHDKSIPITFQPAVVEDSIWPATKCSSYDDYNNKRCDGNETTLAGFLVNVTGSPGRYYFSPSSDLVCDV